MKSMPARFRSWAGQALVLLALAACGGGGGGSSPTDVTPPPTPTGPREPLPTVSRDENPTAARLSLGPQDFLPQTGSARWVYERQNSAGARQGSTSLDALALGSTVQLTEADDGLVFETLRYRVEAGGWVLPDLSHTELPASVVAIIGSLVQFPNPIHGIGTTRVQYRSGSYGLDLDGDGTVESFEFRFRQTIVGFETVASPMGPLEALRIRDELELILIPSRRSSSNVTARAVSETWYARGIGLVREETRSTASDGSNVFEPYTLVLTAATVNGVDVLDPGAVRDIQALDIVHRDLLFDAARTRYYASVPGGAPANGNRIAVIDARTGAVEYSRVVGSEPGVMALAADGGSLYVALDGSSELLRLSLPGLAEMGRVRLPSDGGFGAYVTESMAASPVDPGVVALTLAYTGLSPRHAGVQLVRNMVMQPQRTPGHTGSNIIAFGSDGRFLYGYNNETTEFGLRRIELLPEGLAERQVRPGAVGSFFLRNLDRTQRGLVLGGRLVTEDTMDPLGLVSGASECRAAAAGLQLVCTTELFGTGFELLVVDEATATITTRLRGPSGNLSRRRLVPGPAGQLAASVGIEHPAYTQASQILLMRHPSLP